MRSDVAHLFKIFVNLPSIPQVTQTQPVSDTGRLEVILRLPSLAISANPDVSLTHSQKEFAHQSRRFDVTVSHPERNSSQPHGAVIT